MSHSHTHSHAPDRSTSKRALKIAAAMTATFIVAEVVGGLLSGSLALLADAAHMRSDSASLGIALGAIWLAEKPATLRRSFGYQRAVILADLAGSVSVIVAAIVILTTGWEQADPIIGALIGVLVLASAWPVLRDSVRVLLEQAPVGVEPVRCSPAATGSSSKSSAMP